MRLSMDSFWRAVLYCLHPRVIALSFLPLTLMASVALVTGYFFWETAIDAVNATLQANDWMARVLGWLDNVGFGSAKAFIAPLAIVVLATPLLVVGSLLVVAFLMAPAMVTLVSQRRFTTLERKNGGPFLRSVLWSLGSMLVALVVLVVAIPLYFIPPLVLVLPPLIWGWLTYRVMAYDALAAHASIEERRSLMRAHRIPLLGMGVLAGYLGAAPTLLWVSGAVLLPLAPFLVVAALWLYTLVFAFSSLWFTHYCLSALQKLRANPLPVELRRNEPHLLGAQHDCDRTHRRMD